MYAQHGEDEQHYYGCVTAVDDQVSRLYRTLEKLGVAEQTMVWFCSDNGPEDRGTIDRNRSFTAGLRGREQSLFAGGVGVPAFLYWPDRVEAGRVVDTPCSTLDHFPTVTELIDYALPDRRPIDGVSLAPMIDGKMTVRPRPIPSLSIQRAKRGHVRFAYLRYDRQPLQVLN